MTRTEYTFAHEMAAHAVRREMINKGTQVSLIAFDTSRNLYVFDTYAN